VLDNKSNGGGRGIRTPGTVSRTVVFKTTRFNRSRIPPARIVELSFSLPARVARDQVGPKSTS
jgi:hypothetical protein